MGQVSLRSIIIDWVKGFDNGLGLGFGYNLKIVEDRIEHTGRKRRGR